MGSHDGYAKGTAPFLDRIRRLNAEHNAAVERRRRAVPFWRVLVAALGWRGPAIEWQAREPLDRYYREPDA